MNDLVNHEEPNSQPGVNPYAPTLETSPPELAMTPEEVIRHKYIRHETGIKSIAGLFVLFGIICFLIGLAIEALELNNAQTGPDRLVQLIWVGLGIAHIASAIGIYQFSSWGRWSAVALLTLWLLVVIGAPLALYFFYLLLSRKGAYVFSGEYQRVREMTPQVKYKMGILSWIAVLVFLALVVFAILGGTM